MLDESYGADGIVVSPKIKTPQDIKGKKVAYTRGSPSHFFLIQFLKKNGLSMSDIDRVEVDDPGRAGEAFASGSVDVAVTWEPNISQIVSSGKGRVLESTRTSPGLIVDIMVISPEMYAQRKADVQKFVDGWLRAVEYIKTNQADAYSIMARGINVPAADFPQIAAGIRYADLGKNRELLLPEGDSKAIRIFDEAARVYVEEKLMSEPQRGASLITSEFIPR
jgi:NitT/TauT family transport system substrate-binding protein